MISVWLGDRSGWTGVRLAELDRSSFVDQSGGSWIGAVVRGSEWIGARSLWFVDRSGSERCAWIGALVSGSELVLSGSWIGALCVDRSSLVRGSDWIEALVAWIGVDRSLFRSVLLCVDRSSLCCCVCICFVFLFSLSLCVAVRGE